MVLAEIAKPDLGMQFLQQIHSSPFDSGKLTNHLQQSQAWANTRGQTEWRDAPQLGTTPDIAS